MKSKYDDNVLSFISQTQIILGVGGALLANETCKILYQHALDFKITAFVFFSIVAAYTFLGIKISAANERLSISFSSNKTIKLLAALLSLAATFFLFFLLDKKIQAVCAVLGIATIAYMSPLFLNNKKVKGIRDIFILKSLWLGAVWSVATVLIPVISIKGFALSHTEVLFFMQRFCFITAIALAFNIRDYHVDFNNNMRTIATVAGVNATKFIGALLLLISIFFLFPMRLSLLMNTVFLVSILYTGVLIVLAKPSSKKFFYVVLMDGVLLMQGLLLLFF